MGDERKEKLKALLFQAEEIIEKMPDDGSLTPAMQRHMFIDFAAELAVKIYDVFAVKP